MGSEAHRAPAVTGDAAAAPAGDSRGIPSIHPTCGHGAPACECPLGLSGDPKAWDSDTVLADPDAVNISVHTAFSSLRV